MCDDNFCEVLNSVEGVLLDAEVDSCAVHDVVLVGGSTHIPKVRQMLSDLFGGKELNNRINPDEAVACGAAVLGFILSGCKSKQTEGFELHDVTPHTIGIEADDGSMRPLIKRNTIIPAKTSHVLETYADNMESLQFNVFEGEGDTTDDSYFLGTLELPSIPPEQRGKTNIEVTFELDVNGILNFIVTDDNDLLHNQIRIAIDKGCLRNEDIERMISDASNYDALVEQQRKRSEEMNDIKNYAYSMENITKKRNMDVDLDENDKASIKEAIDIYQAWLHKNPTASNDEYECRKKQLNDTCDCVKSKCVQRLVDACEEIKETIFSLKNNMNDWNVVWNVVWNLDEAAKSTINRAIDECEKWVNDNPMEGVEEIERQNKRLKDICNHAKTECGKRVEKASKKLDETIGSLEENKSDLLQTEKFDDAAKSAIKAFYDSLRPLYDDPNVIKEKYEDYQKKLECACAVIMTTTHSSNDNSIFDVC